MKFSTLLLLFVLVWQVNGVRIFRNGRLAGGNLQVPKSHRKSVADNDKWIRQSLDQFDPNEERMWDQRYLMNLDYHKRDGPAFLLLGGEGPISDGWMTQGAWVDYAKEYNAALFQLEHRFYGESKPTDDLSVENLKYLTSEQALGDAARFISITNEALAYANSTPSEWIVFGGSYSGSLAAWMRLKYPHLVHAVVSSSGPLLAKVDFQDYLRVVAESLATHSDECVSNVKDAYDQIKLLIQDTKGRQKLDQDLKLCDRLEDLRSNQKHISNFFEILADNIAVVVQYNKDQRMTPSKLQNITIDTVCDIMVDETVGTFQERLAAVNALLLDAFDETCLNYSYDNTVKDLSNTTWNGEGSRQWTYQTCTEFGFYQTSSQQPQVFGDQFPIEFFIEQCQDIFDVRYDASFLEDAVFRTNTNYGGLEIEVDNVVFVQGSIDPWHALGITKSLSSSSPAIYINGTAHCANMYPSNDSDIPQLTAARETIKKLIGTWLDS